MPSFVDLLDESGYHAIDADDLLEQITMLLAAAAQNQPTPAPALPE